MVISDYFPDSFPGLEIKKDPILLPGDIGNLLDRSIGYQIAADNALEGDFRPGVEELGGWHLGGGEWVMIFTQYLYYGI